MLWTRYHKLATLDGLVAYWRSWYDGWRRSDPYYREEWWRECCIIAWATIRHIARLREEIERLRQDTPHPWVGSRVREQQTGLLGHVISVTVTGYQVHVRMDDGRHLPHRPSTEFEEAPGADR